MKLRIFHNPRCSKSRQTLQLIRDAGHEPEIIDYQKNPLDGDELRRLSSLLGVHAAELLRSSEAEYKSLGLSSSTPDEEAVRAMIHHPKLMQRPIVVRGKRAVIGRPPENVLDLLS